MQQLGKFVKFWLPFLFVFATGGLLVTMIFIILGYQLLHIDNIYPGVTIDGTDVGGMPPADVSARLTEQATTFNNRVIMVQAADKTWTLTSQDLGMQMNAQATVDAAYAVGRSSNLIADMFIHLRLLSTPHNIETVVHYNPELIPQVVAQLAADVYIAPQNAALAIDNNGQVMLTPSQEGRRLHTESAQSLLEEAVVNPSDVPVTLTVQRIIPPITEDVLASTQRLAEELFREPLVIAYASEVNAAEWRIAPGELVQMFDLVDRVDETGQTRAYLEFRPEAFAPYLEAYRNAINTEPEDAKLSFNPNTRQVSVVAPSRIGYSLDEAALYQQMQALIEQPVRVIQAPVITTPPALDSTNIISLGIRELVAESTSYYNGSSEGRKNNIAVSAAKFHNVTIPPGGIFSFNEHLGEVTKENGFDESLVILGDRTTVGIGGGVCQVSTTVFRAAFSGGFDIVERWAHGYRVRWYELNAPGPGLDATIYTPHVDFKFRNDTDYALLIQTHTDLQAESVTFRFYSTKTDREIEITTPKVTEVIPHGPPIYEDDPTLPDGTVKQVDWANNGMSVIVTRTVRISDTVLHKDTLISEYQPWQAVYKVGTGPAD